VKPIRRDFLLTRKVIPFYKCLRKGRGRKTKIKMKSKLSLIEISNVISAERELDIHQSMKIKCLCLPDMDKRIHEPQYEANRW